MARRGNTLVAFRWNPQILGRFRTRAALLDMPYTTLIRMYAIRGLEEDEARQAVANGVASPRQGGAAHRPRDKRTTPGR